MRGDRRAPLGSQTGVVGVVPVGGEDDEERGILHHRKPRIVVGGELGDEVPEHLMPTRDERRPHLLLEDGDQAVEGPRRPVEVDDHQAGVRPRDAGRLRRPVFERQSPGQSVDRFERPEQVHVVVLPHHGVRQVPACQPERAAVEAGEAAEAGRHVEEPAHPDEAVRRPHHLELPERVHALVPLREQEVLLEVADEVGLRAVREEVVAQLDHLHR